MTDYSDNYSDISRRLWQFKRDESPVTNAENTENVNTNNSPSFKYKSSILGKLVAVNSNGVLKSTKIPASIKYLSNFWQLLEMPLINCKIHLELVWIKNCVMYSIAGNTELEITNTKL